MDWNRKVGWPHIPLKSVTFILFNSLSQQTRAIKKSHVMRIHKREMISVVTKVGVQRKLISFISLLDFARAMPRFIVAYLFG